MSMIFERVNTLLFYGSLKLNAAVAEESIFWDWESNMAEKSLTEMVSWAVGWGYKAFLLLSILFSAYKFGTALVNYFTTKTNDIQLKMQYKNDMKEVITGFAMFFIGINIIAFFVDNILRGQLGGGETFWSIFSVLKDLVK